MDQIFKTCKKIFKPGYKVDSTTSVHTIKQRKRGEW